MKETPIIMSGNHPSLILDGTKTMTRRVIKPQPLNKCMSHISGSFWASDKDGHTVDVKVQFINCPYGQVGDRLWVRETFCKRCYLIDNVRDVCYKEDCLKHNTMGNACGMKWTNSMFMYKWASRITLEITEVRVERLQEISQDDIKAEGVKPEYTMPGGELTGRYSFQLLWNSLNAKYGWDTNPWVWVISFKRRDETNTPA